MGRDDGRRSNETMRFLVVDDSVPTGGIVTNCLRSLGYDEVKEAGNVVRPRNVG